MSKQAMTPTPDATKASEPRRYQDASDLPATVARWRACVNDANGTLLADCRGRDFAGNPTTESDAELFASELVRRWNAEPGLRAACDSFRFDAQALLDWYAGLPEPGLVPHSTALCTILHSLRAALAEGGAA